MENIKDLKQKVLSLEERVTKLEGLTRLTFHENDLKERLSRATAIQEAAKEGAKELKP